MTLKTIFTGLAALLAFAWMSDSPALAQSIFSDNIFERQTAISLMMPRIIFVVACVGVGFGLGWLISPRSEPFRRVGFLIGAALIGLLVVFNNGVLGWGAAWIFAIGGFLAGLFFWIRPALSALGETPKTFGSSRWATPDDLKAKKLFGSDGIRLGQTFDGQINDHISYKGERHLLTVAPTRAGKGTTQIIPNLLSYDGSVLVIDPKGENAMITAKYRQDMGQEVLVVDPWGITNIEGVSHARFNPLDWLDPADNEITENAMILADALIVGDNHSDSFWNEEAKALLQGLLLYVASDNAEDGRRHLGRVRELLVESGDNQQKLFQDMAKSDHRIIASTGNRCLQKDPKLLSNVLASAQAQTHFLDSERLLENLMVSDFKFEDLKTKPMSIYLVLPADRLNTFGRWLRLLVQQAVTVNARNIETKPDKPVLFILDEFATLGRLSMVEQAFGLMAGFGMQLWAIIQDFNQLERIYGESWQSFVANAGMLNYFGSTDQKTADYFSALCGETTVWNFSSAFSTALGAGSNGGSSQTTTDTRAASQRKLAYPDELMRLDAGKQLVFIENTYPMIAEKVSWRDDPELRVRGVDLYAATNQDRDQSAQ